jgi:hypothetical protein
MLSRFLTAQKQTLIYITDMSMPKIEMSYRHIIGEIFYYIADSIVENYKIIMGSSTFETINTFPSRCY